MIANGDSAARNAFRVGLREDTPLPVAGVTQELDPSDILEVQDLAEAIARAEQIVRAPRSSGRDIFEALGEQSRRTDDAAGPAIYSRPTPTPLPAPLPQPESVPRYVITVPTTPTSPDDDAYFHPSGRMRTLADVTLDGYRPEPTLLLRARSRRQRLSWVLVAVLLPLMVLAGFAMFGRAEATVTTVAPPPVTAAPLPTMPATAAALAPTVTAAPTTTPTTNVGKTGKGAIPTFDIKSLPSAGARTKSRGR
jgi:hypothetical protein